MSGGAASAAAPAAPAAPAAVAAASPAGARPLQRWTGACHCGAVRFAIETDFP